MCRVRRGGAPPRGGELRRSPIWRRSGCELMAVDVTTGPGAGDRAGSPEVHAGCVELAGGGTRGGVFSAAMPTCNGKESTDETRSCNRGAGAGRDGVRRGPAVDDDG